MLYEGKQDVIVVFISSKMPSKPSKTDVVIENKNDEFHDTGLKVSSVVRLDKIATILKSLIVGKIGHVGPELRIEVNSKITELHGI